MFQFLIDTQRTIHEALTGSISAFASSRDWSLLAALLPAGVLFGFLHALTPGHSKAVLASYVIGLDMSPRRALGSAFVLSLTHIGTAVLLALVGSALVTRTFVGAGEAPALIWTSRLLLVAIGVWLVVRSIWHHPQAAGHSAAMGVVAGLIPCPLTLFVMVYAISKGVPEAGVAFSVAMLFGVGGVLVAVALASALAARQLKRAIERHGKMIEGLGRILSGLAGAVLVVLALLELTA